MSKEPTQEFLKEVYEAGGFFKDSTRIYQVEYSQAQRQYWYFSVKYEKSKIIGYKIVEV